MRRRFATEASAVTVPTPSAPARLASDKQVAFIARLLDEKDLRAGGKLQATDDEMPKVIADMKAKASSLTIKEASGWIDRLMALPKTTGAAQSSLARRDRYEITFQTVALDGGKTREIGFVKVGSGVPQGKYAVGGLDFANEITFYNLYIGRGENGPFYSLKMYVSDALVPLTAANQKKVLEAIGADPEAASALYGHHHCRCGVCNRKLTNDDSRARGIGPVCADNLGW